MSFKQWIGVELDEVSIGEKVVSVLGGMMGIALLAFLNQSELFGPPLLLASMGASAVLLFAAPHGPMSQPWPVVAGHTLSACVGVTCSQWIPLSAIGAAVAVGLAIGAMHQLKCLHPPGGATALTAVISGPAVCDMGYLFCLWPVFVNSLIIVTIAVLFNYPFAWRRYPTIWSRLNRPAKPQSDVSHDEVVRAIRSLNSFVDITEEDLIQLITMITANHQQRAAVNSTRPSP